MVWRSEVHILSYLLTIWEEGEVSGVFEMVLLICVKTFCPQHLKDRNKEILIRPLVLLQISSVFLNFSMQYRIRKKKKYPHYIRITYSMSTDIKLRVKSQFRKKQSCIMHKSQTNSCCRNVIPLKKMLIQWKLIVLAVTILFFFRYVAKYFFLDT